MQRIIKVGAVVAHNGRIVEAMQYIEAKRIALDARVMDAAMRVLSLESREQAVESRAESYFENVRRLHARVTQSHIDEYVLRFGEGTLHRVIVLVEFGHK